LKIRLVGKDEISYEIMDKGKAAVKLDFSSINSVLIVKLRHHGDVLLTSPLFSALKKNHPHLSVDALIYEETRPFLSVQCGVDNIYSIDRQWKSKGVIGHAAQELKLLKSLQQRKYDLVICLTDQWRLAILTRLLKPRFSIAALCSRRKDSWFWSGSFDQVVTSAKRRHRLAMHTDVLRCLGLSVSSEDEKLSFHISAKDVTSSELLLATERVEREAFIQLHLPSRQAFKMLPVARSAEIVVALWQRFHLPMVFTAAPDKNELEYIQQVETLVQRLDESVKSINLAGKLSITQLAAVTSQTKCFVGVDSAPMHLAAAIDVPVVGLFGPTDFYMWGPAGSRSLIARSGYPCQPCTMKGCANSGDAECLDAIKAADVVAKVVELCR